MPVCSTLSVILAGTYPQNREATSVVWTQGSDRRGDAPRCPKVEHVLLHQVQSDLPIAAPGTITELVQPVRSKRRCDTRHNATTFQHYRQQQGLFPKHTVCTQGSAPRGDKAPSPHGRATTDAPGTHGTVEVYRFLSEAPQLKTYIIPLPKTDLGGNKGAYIPDSWTTPWPTAVSIQRT